MTLFQRFWIIRWVKELRHIHKNRNCQKYLHFCGSLGRVVTRFNWPFLWNCPLSLLVETLHGNRVHCFLRCVKGHYKGPGGTSHMWFRLKVDAAIRVRIRGNVRIEFEWHLRSLECTVRVVNLGLDHSVRSCPSHNFSLIPGSRAR